jgi:uncharacterized protein (TIGR02118 family)
MIKVSVLYPSDDGITFDMTYYLDKHIPMVKALLGDACKNVSVEKGLAGGEPGSAPAFTTMGYLYFESIEYFQQAFAPHANVIVDDIKNFTNAVPLMQISDIII